MLDSGAAVSVVRYEFLADKQRQRLSKSAGAVGANGLPLDVAGQTTLTVSLGSFKSEQEFLVIRNLTVECLLGADFLMKHGAVMDCRTSTLSLGNTSRFEVPMFMEQRRSPGDGHSSDSMAVRASEDMEIAGRTVQLIQGELHGHFGGCEEALVELETGTLPTRLCVARTLSHMTSGKEVVSHVINTCPTSVTVYKGMKLGEAIPRRNALLVDKKNQTAPNHVHSVPEFNLDSTDLTSKEKSQLCRLLTEFANLFACKGGCVVSQTPTVRHTIVTEGPPIRQPVQRLPEALKTVVSDEVEKCWNKEW